MNPLVGPVALVLMDSFRTVMVVGAVTFFVLMVSMQLLLKYRVRSMKGTRVPTLPGPLGSRILKAPHSLVYFFSPTCAACRTLTPQLRALEQSNTGVVTVDVTQNPDLARALNVMATPSTVELTAGTIVGYHVGLVPAAVMARFATPQSSE